MERHTWHKISTPKTTKEPSPRWGHTVAQREHQLIYFAGYADSVYMNDLWTFNTNTMTWKDVKTGGDVPTNRSNCTAHFDSINDELIVFGGGGANKRRFNTLSILNWSTKIWREVHPNSNQSAPWQRTYHSSALLYPYLVVFGGEGIADLDDLWVYDLRSHHWKEVKIAQGKTRPSARRFHTSVLIGNDFYVIAGCYAKYRSLGDVWKIDLTSLLETGNTDELEWQDLRIKGSSFLTRWGHTSAVFQGKIYIFGGRFCNDLQDIIIIDPTKDTLKSMRVAGVAPKARRRHTCAFVGGCMIAFGGFNGQYFNDLSYINVFDARPKPIVPQNVLETSLLNWVNRSYLADDQIKCLDGKSVKIHKGMLVTHFKNQFKLERFLRFLEGRFQQEQVEDIMKTLYLGYGTLPSEINENFEIDLYDSELQKANAIRKMIEPLSSELLSLGSRSKCEVFYLNQQKYQQYLQRFHQTMHYDMLFVVGQDCIPVNKTLITANGPYLEGLLRDLEEDTLDFKFYDRFGDSRVFQVLTCYLQTGFLVVPEEVDVQCWMLMYRLAQYMCLPALMSLCENQMLQLLCQANCKELLVYGADNNISLLAMGSAEVVVSTLIDKNSSNSLQSLYTKQNKSSSQQVLANYIEVCKFDLKQRERREERVQSGLIKRPSENNIEKENESEVGQ